MTNKQPIRIATFLAPNVYPVYRFIVEYIGQKLDYPTEVLFVKSHHEYDDVKPDVSFICGLPYILWKDREPKPIELLVAPVLLGERYEDKPIYFSDVIVRHDSPFQTFEDLRGQKWAYNEKVSQSGYGITRHQLVQMGETNGFFSKVVNGKSHQITMQLVKRGSIDGGAIDTQVLEVELNDQPAYRDELRIIGTFGPSPIQPVVTDTSLPDTLKADIQSVLLEIGDDPSAQGELANGIFKRFALVTDSDYDPIREMLAKAEAANFLTIR